MNQIIKNKLKSIFAKELNKNVADLSSSDIKLFEEWISLGMAAEYIDDCLLEPDIVCNDNIKRPDITRTGNEKCRNCENLVLSLSTKKRFGYETVHISIYCSYWYNKNKQYKNVFYHVKLNDVACTRFIQHKNVLDFNKIDVSDMTIIPINEGDFSSLPIMSFIDKGYDVVKEDGMFYLEKGGE